MVCGQWLPKISIKVDNKINFECLKRSKPLAAKLILFTYIEACLQWLPHWFLRELVLDRNFNLTYGRLCGKQDIVLAGKKKKMLATPSERQRVRYIFYFECYYKVNCLLVLLNITPEECMEMYGLYYLFTEQ